MEQRAPSATPKGSASPYQCRCGSEMPKTSYLCRGCWGGLTARQKADLKVIKRAIQERRLHQHPRLGLG